MSSSSLSQEKEKQHPKNLCWLNSLVAFLYVNRNYIEITLPLSSSSLSTKNKIKHALKESIFSSQKIEDTIKNNVLLYHLIMAFLKEKGVTYGISETADDNQNDPTDVFNMFLDNKIIKISKKNFFNIFSFSDFIIKTNNQRRQSKLFKNILKGSDSFIMFLTNRNFPGFKHYILVFKEESSNPALQSPSKSPSNDVSRRLSPLSLERDEKCYVYSDGTVIEKTLKDFCPPSQSSQDDNDKHSSTSVFELNLFSLHVNL